MSGNASSISDSSQSTPAVIARNPVASSWGWNDRDEPPWVGWRLGLLDSNPGGVGLLGSVEGCFELGGGHVAAVAVEPLLVEPVHPGEGGEFDLVDVVPGPGRVGPVDALGLVEAVGRLGQCVVVGVCNRADRWSGADLLEAL